MAQRLVRCYCCGKRFREPPHLFTSELVLPMNLRKDYFSRRPIYRAKYCLTWIANWLPPAYATQWPAELSYLVEFQRSPGTRGLSSPTFAQCSGRQIPRDLPGWMGRRSGMVWACSKHLYRRKRLDREVREALEIARRLDWRGHWSAPPEGDDPESGWRLEPILESRATGQRYEMAGGRIWEETVDFNPEMTRAIAHDISQLRARENELRQRRSLERERKKAKRMTRLAKVLFARRQKAAERRARSAKLKEVNSCRRTLRKLAVALRKSDLAALPSLAEEFKQLTSSPNS